MWRTLSGWRSCISPFLIRAIFPSHWFILYCRLFIFLMVTELSFYMVCSIYKPIWTNLLYRIRYFLKPKVRILCIAISDTRCVCIMYDSKRTKSQNKEEENIIQSRWLLLYLISAWILVSNLHIMKVRNKLEQGYYTANKSIKQFFLYNL